MLLDNTTHNLQGITLGELKYKQTYKLIKEMIYDFNWEIVLISGIGVDDAIKEIFDNLIIDISNINHSYIINIINGFEIKEVKFDDGKIIIKINCSYIRPSFSACSAEQYCNLYRAADAACHAAALLPAERS